MGCCNAKERREKDNINARIYLNGLDSRELLNVASRLSYCVGCQFNRGGYCNGSFIVKKTTDQESRCPRRLWDYE